MYFIVENDNPQIIIECSDTGSMIPMDYDNYDYRQVIEDVIEQGSDCWDGDIPTEVQDKADSILFARQLQKYKWARIRLDKYEVAVGVEEVIESRSSKEQVLNEETQEMEDVMIDVVVVQAIEPVEATITRTIYAEGSEEPTEETIENPLITQDNAERAEAQAIVDATPQPVIDEYNS